jgi:hypothetical protein
MKMFKLALIKFMIGAFVIVAPVTVALACDSTKIIINSSGEPQICYLAGERGGYCYYDCY